jgi:hypothetical protein
MLLKFNRTLMVVYDNETYRKEGDSICRSRETTLSGFTVRRGIRPSTSATVRFATDSGGRFSSRFL